MKPSVFIIGSPRSGTTLLRLMLTSHPFIVVPPECGFIIWWLEKYRDWNAAAADSERAVDFVADLARSKKIETWDLDFDALLTQCRRARPANYSALVSLVNEAYARRRKPGFHRWGDKNNFHVRHVETLHSLFPKAQFLHLVRDGRDVACSYQQLGRAEIKSLYAPKLPTDIVEIAAEWKGNVEAVGNAFSTIPPAQRLEIRYEDIVTQSESILREVCEFLDESYSPQMLDYHVLNRRDGLEPSEFLRWKPKTLDAPDAAALGKFRTELSAAEIKSFEEIAGGLLRKYRYP
jgi:hypothetical protein